MTLALEWRLCWRAGGTRAVLAALLLALLAALATGGAHVARSQQALAAAAAEEAEALRAARATTLALDTGALAGINPRRDPRDAGTYGNLLLVTYAMQPTQPLAALAIGQSDQHARYVRLHLGSRDKAAGSADLASPESLLSGPFDVAFVLVWLLPLALVALCHGVGGADRERGLAALLAVATPRPERVWSRRLWLRGALVYALGAAGVLGAWVAGRAAGGPGEAGVALALVLAALAIYVAFWTAVCGAVARRAPGPAASALRLVSTWVLLLVVMPAAANVIARSVAPVPSRAEFVKALRDATDRVEAQRAAVLDRFLFDHPELAEGVDAATLPAGFARLVTTRAVEAEAARIEERYARQMARQQRVVAVFEVLSPPLAFQALLERAAGSDLAWQRDFAAQTARHHEALRDFFLPLLRAPAGEAVTAHGAAVRGAAVATPGERPHFGHPAFVYETPGALWRPSASTGLGLSLALLVALLLTRSLRAAAPPRVPRAATRATQSA